MLSTHSLPVATPLPPHVQPKNAAQTSLNVTQGAWGGKISPSSSELKLLRWAKCIQNDTGTTILIAVLFMHQDMEAT